MIMIANLNAFLSLKVNQISTRYSIEKAVLYRSFYYDVSNGDLKDIFAILHSQLNDLFSFMNDRNNPGFGGHFNAEPSRELLDIYEQIRLIQATLKDEFPFDIDAGYAETLKTCRGFLSKYGGSRIPVNFPIINIVEGKPIFSLANSTAVQGPTGNSSVKLQLIGEGSYAKVFKYKDPNYGSYFAIKRAKDYLRPDELVRFKNEYIDLKALDSPFIIKAYQYNQEKDEYTMEYADFTLEKFIFTRNSSLPFNERKSMIIQMLKAFEYIHAQDLLHRDISYHNILVKCFDDGTNMVKVSDFGLVKRPESALTRQGTDVKGAINDYSDLDAVGFENYEMRHETYAIAKVIYYILTGRQSGYNRENNAELKNFLLKAISSNKEDRFTSVKEMREELSRKVFPWFKTPSPVL